MFARVKLGRAIIDGDIERVRAIVAKSGRGILAKPLTIGVSRPYRPGDEWLKSVLRTPTPLCMALLLGNDELARELIALGASPLQKASKNYPNVLFVAAAVGRAELLAEWIELYQGAAREKNWDNDTLLHIACLHKQSKCTQVLLARGFYTQDRSKSGSSPLLYAEKAADFRSMQLLNAAARGHLPASGRTSASVQDETPKGMPAVVPPAHIDQQPHVGPIRPVQDMLAAGDTNWHVIDADRVARVTEAAAIGYCLTDIFNFATGEVLHLSRNLETGAETAAVSRFADLPRGEALSDAAARLGRQAPASGLRKKPE